MDPIEQRLHEKSDEELRGAAARLSQFPPEVQARIRAELERRSMSGAMPDTGAASPSEIDPSKSSPQSAASAGRPSYKVVPFIGLIRTGFFSSDNAGTVAQQLQTAIQAQMNAGWEFHTYAKVDIEVKPGCLAALFGAKTAYITFDQLVFRRS